ncbi:hypothetical protein GBAR_LOCUS5592 [Geodia barretti]|uniref:Fibronectin type-III domain-containing protein n=1 Tax=Geodia barretti TaxID=519541 RepID=A0AA35WCB9_GEOBA|nr:hypothetical protein GBAR_LOCUS5592 [Geodia barretti]
MTIWMVLLLLIAKFVQGDKNFAGFIESPQPSLSPLLSSASFSCSVNSTEVRELLWEVDGGQTSSDSYAESLRGRGLNWTNSKDNQKWSLQLTVLASKENNGTRIVCVAFTVSDGIIKTPATHLYAYGHPSAPGNVSLIPIPPGQLSLTWSKPYSPPTVSISYMVTITELDPITKTIVGQSFMVMVENSIMYTFTPAVQSCNEYSFQIQAENEAGTSGYSKAVSATLPIAPNMTQLSSSLTHSLAIDDNGDVTCNITFLPAEACPDYPVIRYTLNLLNTITNTTTVHHLLPTLLPTAPLLKLDSSDGLERDSRYLYFVTAKGGAGLRESERRQMVTTDVSDVVVSLDCPTLNITCHLLPGSLAKGCFISLIPPPEQKPEESSEQMVLNKTIPRLNSSLEARATLVLSPQSCCYQLKVYDWEAEGSVGLISIPLTTGSELCDVPEVVTGENTTGSNMGSSWLYLAPIVASVVGGVVLIAAMLLLVGLGIYCHRKTRTVQPAKESNQEPPPSQEPRSHDPPNTVPPPPPLYDQPDSLVSSVNFDEEVRYSILTRDSFSSHAPLTTDITQQPLYSKLNHYDAVNPLGNHSSTTLSLQPWNTHIYSEPHSTGRDHEFINSVPSAGTSV